MLLMPRTCSHWTARRRQRSRPRRQWRQLRLTPLATLDQHRPRPARPPSRLLRFVPAPRLESHAQSFCTDSPYGAAAANGALIDPHARLVLEHWCVYWYMNCRALTRSFSRLAAQYGSAVKAGIARGYVCRAGCKAGAASSLWQRRAGAFFTVACPMIVTVVLMKNRQVHRRQHCMSHACTRLKATGYATI